MVALKEKESLSRAESRLHVTQSALGRHLHRMKAEVGVNLISTGTGDRTNQRKSSRPDSAVVQPVSLVSEDLCGRHGFKLLLSLWRMAEGWWFKLSARSYLESDVH